MQNLNNILVKNISDTIYNHINEMARTKLNKTIDPKIWATVSSICSRNRSTDAEFIKPIGTDKKTLLERYVAALLIMKKQCPESIEDINNLKTFKLVGNKFIELGGTLKEIQDLYNKNISSNNISKSNNISTESPISNEPEETDDSWESIFDKYEDDDNSNDDGFFAGLELEDNSMEHNILSITLPLPYDADIKTIFLLLTKLSQLTGFKEENKKNKNEYTYLKYISSTPAGKSGIKLYKQLCNTWTEYRNDSIDILFDKTVDNTEWYIGNSLSFLDYTGPIDFTYNDSLNTVIKKYEQKYNQKKANNNLYSKKVLKNIYNKYIQFVNNIPDEYLKNIAAQSSLYEYILVSPDGGMIFTKKYELGDTQYEYGTIINSRYPRNISNFLWNNNTYRFRDESRFGNEIDAKKLEFKIIYEIHFTGKVNYYELIENKYEQLKILDNSKRFTKLKKVSAALKKYIISHIYPLLYCMPLNVYYMSFDVNKNPMYKHIATSLGWSDDPSDHKATWYNKSSITRYYWYKPNKQTGLIKIHSTKYPGYMKYTTDIAEDYDFVKQYTLNGWKLTGQISDEHDFVAATSYENKNNNEKMYCINLTPKGAAEFRKMINVDEYIK